ncbi:MAG: flagellar hook protein [Candidatus Eremiobacteraeota bacterium]|nr:flagellar hook protein [Candidatus Eremiobacteraeota bacterium]
MSGIGATSTSSSTPAGTNVPPVSFPGIASGIDYNSIIQKYTDLTLQQETPLKTNVTNLTNQNAELLKIQDLLSKFQATFTTISDPANFSATAPSSTNATAIAATAVAGGSATPGTYTITKTLLATATQYANDPAANGTFNSGVVLANAGASISPNNGTTGPNGKGQLTINGVAMTYDVNSTTLTSLIAANSAALAAVGVTLTDNGNGTVSITSTQPLTLGSASDSGNLLQVLKLDTAPVTFSGGTYTATSASKIGGINLGATFNTSNNAGFATAVTSGTFTINGVHFTVNAAGNNLNNMISQINASSAGVVASYDQANDRVLITAKASGPQGVSFGAAGDTSNFLQAVGFLSNAGTPNVFSAGATTTVGKSAEVDYTDSAGTSHVAYANSNTVTNVIPGVSLALQQAIGGTTGIAPVTITVAQDTTALTTAIGTFVTAYNAVIDEINTATVAPVVGKSTSSTTGTSTGTQLTTGGVLFNNQDILSLKDRLVNFVSGFGSTGSKSYNSWASVGLMLDNSFTVNSATSSNTSNTSSQNNVTTQSFAGTSGKLVALDTTKFAAALAADGNAVAKLFTGTTSIVGQLGAYLTAATGLPTQLTGGLAGKIPVHSLFSTLTDAKNNQITSLQQQIQLVTDQANLQANTLRAQFTASETLIAQLQSVQSSLGQLTGSTSSR